jgi:mannonate dehydratase
MKMTFRWFGAKDDSISLRQIRQIPGVTGVVGTIADIPAGEVWQRGRIAALKNEVNGAGLGLPIIESVNVHDAIKTGADGRDLYIENYRTTIRNLAEAGITVICYNFMPVFDWMRSDLAMRLEDGSTVSSFVQSDIDRIDTRHLVETFKAGAKGYSMPGWEPERIGRLKELFDEYEHITEEKLVANLKYFLERIIPVCEECGVKMAIHPDDPPWSIFGLPRIVRNSADLERILGLVDSPCNGITFCCGALGASPENDLPAMIRRFGKRIYFTHIRNVKILSPGNFHEVSHRSGDGSLDIYEIVKAYHDTGWDGYVRPDHGRMLEGEHGRPGYGFFDRAMGITYINGLWEALDKGGTAGKLRPRS